MAMSLRGIIIVIFLFFFMAGCAEVNFSANYYTPPAGYRQDVTALFERLTHKLPLSHHYRVQIVSDKESKGIPRIEGRTVQIPDKFVKYVYQNYYNDRFKVLLSVMMHELAHARFGLPDKPPKEHFLVDRKAVEGCAAYLTLTPEDYYRSLYVMRNYWFARKGMGGQLFNWGWNVGNAVSLATVGAGYFRNWFATDLGIRMKLMIKTYHLRSRGAFKRSAAPAHLRFAQKPDFSVLFRS